MNDRTKNEPGIGALLGSLVSDTGMLVRQEIHLASAEMGHKARRATEQVGIMAIGGALTHAGTLAIIAAIVLGLGTVIHMWISALVIGVIAAGIGWAIIHKGAASLRDLDPVPRETLEALTPGTAMKESTR